MNFEEILKRHGYKQLSFLGGGSYGRCYLIESDKYNRQFACKIIQIPQNRMNKKEFYYNEFEALKRLSHRNVIGVYDFFDSDNCLFVVLEYCSEGNLEDYIKKNGKMNDSDLRMFTYQMLSGFSFIHSKHIAHRDIKPANILISDSQIMKICDFGFAELVQTPGSKSQNFCGSLAFMPPELIQRKAHDPFKADIWSFGITLYYASHGRLPFPDARTPTEMLSNIELGYEIDSSVPNDIAFIIKKSLSKTPENRMSFIELMELIDNDEKELINTAIVLKTQTHKEKNETKTIPFSLYYPHKTLSRIKLSSRTIPRLRHSSNIRIQKPIFIPMLPK